jgi:hypothetical protein
MDAIDRGGFRVETGGETRVAGHEIAGNVLAEVAAKLRQDAFYEVARAALHDEHARDLEGAKPQEAHSSPYRTATDRER